MSIEAIEFIVDGVPIRREINGQEQDLSIPIEELPFIVVQQTMTREEFDAVYGDKKKKKKHI